MHAHDHHHHHGHHHHGHAARSAANKRRLTLTLVLVAAYVVAEVIGGLLANSLALLADAGHTLSDVAALGLSLFALWIAEKPATPQRTYGYYRAEILAALVNGTVLVVIAVFIFVEAVERFREPPDVRGGVMMAVATGGVLINLLGLWILSGGRAESLNVRGAWLHVLGDMLGSAGTVLAGGLVLWLGWTWADPAIAAVVAALVIYSAWRLLGESVSVLMESAPRGIDVDEVRATIRRTPGVRAVHALHVWSITTGMDALSAHVVVEDGRPHLALLKELRSTLHDRFGIDHMTIQIEPEGFEDHAEGDEAAGETAKHADGGPGADPAPDGG